jgi:hypothetical protein
MVTFVSLFLWLMTDVHPVKVAVDPSVASVEILLDGRSIGVATAPEWEVECDFGTTLRPHELVAVARDDAGVEIDRAVQLVNLPRPDAEVEIVFESESPEQPTTLRVITESAERLHPLAVFVTFDGLLLHRDTNGSFVLPAYDPQQMHLVSAEAHFPEGVTARRDLTFGGAYGGRIVSQLTAVPVALDDRRDLTADELDGLLVARGRDLKIAAVDRQGARVYVVRDHGAWPSLRNTGLMMDRMDFSASGIHKRKLARVSEENGLASEIPPGDDRFYLVVPNPTAMRGLSLFPILRPFNIDRWGMAWLSTHIVSTQSAISGQRLAEAVALAGLRAASEGCPRAVVLVTGKDPVDVSRHGPAAVREYLQALRVPLVVWSTARDGSPPPWGQGERVRGLTDVDQASRRLLKSLRRQWIVWVEGEFRPDEIDLVENSKGIRLAG